jgi:hypothetical protein
MQPDNDVREQVFEFVTDYWSVDRSRLNDNTTLFGDLGIGGDDGDEILHAYSQRFNVDMSGCEVRRHFGSEGGCMPLAPFYWLYTAYRRRRYGLSAEQSCGLVEITIDDLVAAAIEGRWRK